MSIEDERLKQQFAFALEADKEKQIFRQTWLSDGERKENDAEHAWHMALMAILMAEHANEKIDILKTVTMILIHDIVEIDAGDTYAYDEEGKRNQKEREAEAARRLYGLLPEDQGQYLKSLFEEFEEGKTPEARFAHTMDNIQPMMLNVAADGKAWTEHKIKVSQVLKRNEHTGEGSERIWEYAKENYILPSLEDGCLADDRKDKKQELP